MGSAPPTAVPPILALVNVLRALDGLPPLEFDNGDRVVTLGAYLRRA